MLDMIGNMLLLEQALQTLGAVLAQRGQRFELVTIGGSSLMLLGLIVRPTRDLDVVALAESGHYLKANPLPEALREASRDVGETLGIGGDWLNAGPTDLLDFGLPAGFQQRVQIRRYHALTLHLAGRFDQICFKLYATVDQSMNSKHADDLRLLQPIPDELLQAATWTRTHDPSVGFRTELLAVLRAFGVEEADGIV
ncbi:MAG TPA: hypothetical protein VIU62_02895 [Chloroflexota bacterium]|jgi:hypothetical protein